MRHKGLLATAAVACCVLLTSGCGMLGGGQTPPTTTPNAVDGKIGGSISFQTWNLKAGYQDYFDNLIKSFEKKYPGTSIDWIDQPADGYSNKLQAEAQGGTLPDVINVDPPTGYPLAVAGYLLDISVADPDAEKDFMPAAWEAMHFPETGGAYGYPWYLNTGPMMYNTALMQKGGLDPNVLPTTYDDLFADANKMAQTLHGQYAMIGSTPVIETFAMYGVEIMNEDETEFTFNSAKGVELVQQYKDLYDNGGMLKESLSQTYTGETTEFEAGKIASATSSAYEITQIQNNAPTVFASLQVGPQITNTSPNMYAQDLAVAATSKNQATALAFAKWVTNAENQLAFAKQVAVFPSTVGTLDNPFFTQSDGSLQDQVAVESGQQIAEAKILMPAQFSDQMKNELRDEVALAIEGKKPIQQALDETVTYANQHLVS